MVVLIGRLVDASGMRMRRKLKPFICGRGRFQQQGELPGLHSVGLNRRSILHEVHGGSTEQYTPATALGARAIIRYYETFAVKYYRTVSDNW